MHCVNCGCRLTFFNETDELWGGTERALCHTCRERVSPFLDETCVGSHVDHLRERRAALVARGVTAEGLAHLQEYCKHLDELTVKPGIPSADDVPAPLRPKRRAEESPLAALRRTMKSEPGDEAPAAEPSRGDRELRDLVIRSNQIIRSDIRENETAESERIRILTDRIERLSDRLRLITYFAAAGAGSGILAFLAVMVSIIIR